MAAARQDAGPGCMVVNRIASGALNIVDAGEQRALPDWLPKIDHHLDQSGMPGHDQAIVVRHLEGYAGRNIRTPVDDSSVDQEVPHAATRRKGRLATKSSNSSRVQTLIPNPVLGNRRGTGGADTSSGVSEHWQV